MCGIVYVRHRKPKKAKRNLLRIYKDQKERGQAGFGYVAVTDGVVTAYVRATTHDEIIKELEKENAHEYLFHHRFPTSTVNLKEAAHPIKVSHKSFKHDYYVVHNGVINNDEERKKVHEALGFEYTTSIKEFYQTQYETYYMDEKFNDSEALAIDVARAIELKLDKVESTGSIAFMAYQVDKETQKVVSLCYGRNYSNPLKVREFSIASGGKGEDAKPHMLFRYDYELKMLFQRDLTFGAYSYDWRKDFGKKDDKDKKEPMGFQHVHKTLPVIQTEPKENKEVPVIIPPKTEEELLAEELADDTFFEKYDDYESLQEELKEIQEQIKNIRLYSPEDTQKLHELVEERDIIERQIATYEKLI